MGKGLRYVSHNLDDKCLFDLLTRKIVVAEMDIRASEEILGFYFVADDNYLSGDCVKGVPLMQGMWDKMEEELHPQSSCSTKTEWGSMHPWGEGCYKTH